MSAQLPQPRLPKVRRPKSTTSHSSPHKLEPACAPVWQKRAKQLQLLLTEPKTTKQLLRAAGASFCFTHARTINALATGEGKLFYFYPCDQTWRLYNTKRKTDEASDA
jgi:hypothetical protein